MCTNNNNNKCQSISVHFTEGGFIKQLDGYREKGSPCRSVEHLVIMSLAKREPGGCEVGDVGNHQHVQGFQFLWSEACLAPSSPALL